MICGYPYFRKPPTWPCIGHLHPVTVCDSLSRNRNLKVVVSGIALWWRNALGPRSLPGVSCAPPTRRFANKFGAFKRLPWFPSSLFWLWRKNECKNTGKGNHIYSISKIRLTPLAAPAGKRTQVCPIAQAVLIGTNAMKSSDVGQAKSKCRKSILHFSSNSFCAL